MPGFFKHPVSTPSGLKAGHQALGLDRQEIGEFGAGQRCGLQMLYDLRLTEALRPFIG